MVANYRQTVLTAFSEVEDNLAAQTLLASQYETQGKALNAARKQLEIATQPLPRRANHLSRSGDGREHRAERRIQHGCNSAASSSWPLVTLVKSLGGGMARNDERRPHRYGLFNDWRRASDPAAPRQRSIDQRAA